MKEQFDQYQSSELYDKALRTFNNLKNRAGRIGDKTDIDPCFQSFDGFLEQAGLPESKKAVLVRIVKSRGYAKNNLAWVCRLEHDDQQTRKKAHAAWKNMRLNHVESREEFPVFEWFVSEVGLPIGSSSKLTLVSKGLGWVRGNVMWDHR